MACTADLNQRIWSLLLLGLLRIHPPPMFIYCGAASDGHGTTSMGLEKPFFLPLQLSATVSTRGVTSRLGKWNQGDITASSRTLDPCLWSSVSRLACGWLGSGHCAMREYITDLLFYHRQQWLDNAGIPTDVADHQVAHDQSRDNPLPDGLRL